MESRELAEYLDELLNVSGIEDASLNGLQVENTRDVKIVGLAVDISQDVIRKACDMHVDFLIVHHGLFWGKSEAITGAMYQRIRLMIVNDIALYAAHLPLDVHPEFGNNVQIREITKWPATVNFGEFQGMPLGTAVTFDPPRALNKIVDDLRRSLKVEPQVWNFGPASVKKLGFISGSGIGFMDQALDAGLDTLVTGEPKHSAYWEAREAGMNVVLAGHYATETLGVKAVGRHLEEKFKLETIFIDLPTGY
ncbi:Nif3-like dinuclear metal center hexameric protein [bacterium]|nr:Nif3-like dinuclear metal center hexameric protein [bacterium]RQV97950.1 MAG: Nif3-like dinuclear metal center hexameric protein [bacterium]